ncbi:transcriptional repressor DicA [compost metagenome]
MKDGRYIADRHFRDLAYNGRTRAKIAARCYRDDMAREHGVQLSPSVKSSLAEQRQAARLTQAAVAKMLAISPGLVAKWERQDNLPAAARSLYRASVAGTIPTGPAPLVGRDIRRIRTDVLHWTQSQLAEALGWSYAAIGYWEREQRRAPGWVLVYLNAVNEGWVIGEPSEQ